MPAAPARDTAPREQLLARATDYVAAHGIADLSLRGFATALGTSHRMLIYHFGSREGLLAAIVEETERRQRAAFGGLRLEPGVSVAEMGRRMWKRFADPRLWPLERLFFEIYAGALQDRDGFEGFLASAIEPWIEPMAEVYRSLGATPATARARARLGIAVMRGLLLDLLATGDRRGVDRAFEAFVDLYERAAGA